MTTLSSESHRLSSASELQYCYLATTLVRSGLPLIKPHLDCFHFFIDAATATTSIVSDIPLIV
jgi:hypothetical protein